MKKIDTLEKAAREILEGRIDSAKELIQAEYPFKILTSVGRNYTDQQKMVQFKKDGDGLTALFVKLVEADSLLLEDPYIKNGTSYRRKNIENNEITALRINSF